MLVALIVIDIPGEPVMASRITYTKLQSHFACVSQPTHFTCNRFVDVVEKHIIYLAMY